MITIEKAILEDLSSIMEIENLTYGAESFSESHITSLINEDQGKFYILKKRDNIVAYLSLLDYYAYSYLYIYSIAVHPAERRQHLADALMEKAFEYARQKGLKEIHLEVNVNNDSAISLYKKYGFIQGGRISHYYQDGSDAWRMVSSITG
jgi:ribosomal-protein-alanine N-acetyltransferase